MPDVLDFQPLERPEKFGLGHMDAAFTAEDDAVADRLGAVGDIYMDRPGVSPREQWRVVARALRIHGLQIVNREERRPIESPENW